MKKITADWVCPVVSAPIKDGVLICDDAGKILAVEPREQHAQDTLEVHKGILIPGFINTHCHLELSHMKNKVDTGTGLIPFITGVVTRRNASAEAIQEAIQAAEQEMIEGGIVAVGDISNVPDTFMVKSRGRLRYYTFVEVFDFLQENNANETFEKGRTVWEQLDLAPGSARSIVPHAPYSVSQNLFALINQFNPSSNTTVSIHNQETPPEEQLFREGKGGFYDFYQKFGVSLDEFSPTGQSALFYAISNLNPYNRTLFVHNTLTTRADIEAANHWSQYAYWATCPNANLYIENRLPDYSAFIETNARMTIGTDSLTSNWQLSVLEEIKTISRFQSYVPFEKLLRWATLNGAEALGFDDALGSLEPGKTPGILLLQGVDEHWKLSQNATVQRLL